jgi:hypothetical protein
MFVNRGNTKEDRNRIEAVIDDVKDSMGDIPAAAEIATGKAEDKGQRVQGF